MNLFRQMLAKKKRLLVAVVVIPAVIGIGLHVFHFRPLVKADGWLAVIEAEESKELGEVYRMVGDDDKLFVRFMSPFPAHVEGYPWFSLRPSRRFLAIPNWPREEPYLHFNHDMALGVEITDPKVGGNWSVELKMPGIQ